ncbi:hypothetical protein TWF225_000691 [Orbilia oligospora]|nr:hypothetical protein TWF751_002075 [Orbilia oligospora]KAF3166745.1 hypothetical protein TWF225_000691 [Orbilia oligospora]KAF3237216.1 hypothetical protein TWF128_000982 [Orbilia oligospora]
MPLLTSAYTTHANQLAGAVVLPLPCVHRNFNEISQTLKETIFWPAPWTEEVRKSLCSNPSPETLLRPWSRRCICVAFQKAPMQCRSPASAINDPEVRDGEAIVDGMSGRQIPGLKFDWQCTYAVHTCAWTPSTRPSRVLYLRL